MHRVATSLAEAQHGVVSRAQLRNAGVPPHLIDAMPTSRAWGSVTPMVLRRVGAPSTEVQRVMAAILDSGADTVLSHRSATALFGYRGTSLTRPIHLTRTSRSSRTPEGACLHIVRQLPDRWVTVYRGVPIVRPELLLIQLFATEPLGRAERIADALWGMRLFSGASLGAFIGEFCRRGRDGAAGLRAYLAERGVDYTPPATSLESRVQQIVRAAGIPVRRQVDSGGVDWSGRVDFRHDTLPIVIEVQSELHHTALVDQRSDDLRKKRLRADGFVVVEVSDQTVWTRPAEVVAKVEGAIRQLRSVPRSPV